MRVLGSLANLSSKIPLPDENSGNSDIARGLNLSFPSSARMSSVPGLFNKAKLIKSTADCVVLEQS